MKITDRYTSAVHSRNLKSEERTQYSDTDVLGAMGLASRVHPLSAALTRLFAGDNRASREIVEILAELVWKRARTIGVKLSRLQADDLARACLAWFRDGTCKPCGGHGKERIPGTTTMGAQDCKVCRGTRKVPFERLIVPERRLLASWLQAEMQRELSRAGPEAMKLLGPSLALGLQS